MTYYFWLGKDAEDEFPSAWMDAAYLKTFGITRSDFLKYSVFHDRGEWWKQPRAAFADLLYDKMYGEWDKWQRGLPNF